MFYYDGEMVYDVGEELDPRTVVRNVPTERLHQVLAVGRTRRRDVNPLRLLRLIQEELERRHMNGLEVMRALTQERAVEAGIQAKLARRFYP